MTGIEEPQTMPTWQLVVSPGDDTDGCDECNKWVGGGYLLGKCLEDDEPAKWLCLGCIAARVRKATARHLQRCR